MKPHQQQSVSPLSLACGESGVMNPLLAATSVNCRSGGAYRLILTGNALIRIAGVLLLLMVPALVVLWDISDPGTRLPQIPRVAWTVHRALTPKIRKWAEGRLGSDRASRLSTADISGTEWPLFGNVFYLLATESLQKAWEANRSLTDTSPKQYAAEAIEATARLVLDPGQAGWVKQHWGDKYLSNEDLFYRMLLISAATSHVQLTGKNRYLPLLREQVESLSAELDRSPHGLLDDYPGQCYPGDVVMAIAMIRRADKVLGTDHRAFVDRALRGFQGRNLDPQGLVPYAADSRTGDPLGASRGCDNSYVSLFAPGLWPEQARDWYALYAQHYWQHSWTALGFREFPHSMPDHEWYMDVDSGPVVAGFGFSACAFGVGAARANGQFEHAFPLTTEMLAMSLPMPDGTLIVPRLLSNGADAPFLGESAILFNLTRLPENGSTVQSGGSIPTLTMLVLILEAAIGLTVIALSAWTIRRCGRRVGRFAIPAVKVQLGIWFGFVVTGVVLVLFGHWIFGAILVVLAQLMPAMTRRAKETE